MADFAAVHSRLREILLPYGSEYVITRDDPAGVTLEVPGLEGKPWGYVAGTRVGKRYVSFYLMPVYASAELSASISPGLAKRRQGKSCFNFTTLDEPLFVELEGVAAKGSPGSAPRPRRSMPSGQVRRGPRGGPDRTRPHPCQMCATRPFGGLVEGFNASLCTARFMSSSCPRFR